MQTLRSLERAEKTALPPEFHLYLPSRGDASKGRGLSKVCFFLPGVQTTTTFNCWVTGNLGNWESVHLEGCADASPHFLHPDYRYCSQKNPEIPYCLGYGGIHLPASLFHAAGQEEINKHVVLFFTYVKAFRPPVTKLNRLYT